MQPLLTKIYAYRIFSEFMLLYPLYNVMFAERGGLSTLHISIMLGIWSGIILLFEIPSGALADKYSRKKLLALAQLIRAAGYTLWVFWPTFEGFLLGLALWGAGRSMTSGAFEALVFDELKATGQERQYAKVIGRTESLALFFSLGSTLAAAPVFAWFGYSGILWGSVAATIVAAIIVLTLPDKKRQAPAAGMAYGVILRQAAREVRRNHALIKLIIFGVFVGMLFRIFDEYASLIIKDAGVSTVLIPLVSALIFLPVIVADFFAYRLERLQQITFMLFLAAAGVALVAAGVWLGPGGLVGFAIAMLLIKVSITVFGAKVQHAITGQTRATVTSINSFGVEVAAVAAFLAYGMISHISGVSGALITFGVAAGGTGIVYLFITRGWFFRKRFEVAAGSR